MQWVQLCGKAINVNQQTLNKKQHLENEKCAHYTDIMDSTIIQRFGQLWMNPSGELEISCNV